MNERDRPVNAPKKSDIQNSALMIEELICSPGAEKRIVVTVTSKNITTALTPKRERSSMRRSLRRMEESIYSVTLRTLGYFSILSSEVSSGLFVIREVATMILSAGSRWNLPGRLLESIMME